MKTTLELSDELFVAAKLRAASERTTLRAIVERGLRTQLGSAPRKRGRRPGVKWVTVPGGLPADVDLSDRASMHDWLRRTR